MSRKRIWGYDSFYKDWNHLLGNTPANGYCLYKCNLKAMKVKVYRGSRDLKLRIYFLSIRFENHDLLSYNLLLGYAQSLKSRKSFFFVARYLESLKLLKISFKS